METKRKASAQTAEGKSKKRPTKPVAKRSPASGSAVEAIPVKGGGGPGEGVRFQVRRNRFVRTYEITGFHRVGDDTLAVEAKPVFKEGVSVHGRPRTVGYLKLEEAA